MPYFSNKPPPTPGHQLPKPNAAKKDENADKDEKMSLKRKLQMESAG